jgi:hypothetical protein
MFDFGGGGRLHPSALTDQTHRLPRRPLRLVHSAFPRVSGMSRCVMSKRPSAEARLSAVPLLHGRSKARRAGGAGFLGALAQARLTEGRQRSCVAPNLCAKWRVGARSWRKAVSLDRVSLPQPQQSISLAQVRSLSRLPIHGRRSSGDRCGAGPFGPDRRPISQRVK